MLRRRQLGILRQQGERVPSRLLQNSAIAHQIGCTKFRQSPLPDPKELTGASDAEILLRNDESIRRLHECFQALSGRRDTRRGIGDGTARGIEQQTGGLVRSPAYPTAQLMQLG